MGTRLRCLYFATAAAQRRDGLAAAREPVQRLPATGQLLDHCQDPTGLLERHRRCLHEEPADPARSGLVEAWVRLLRHQHEDLERIIDIEPGNVGSCGERVFELACL